MKSDTPARDGRSARWDRHRAERRLELVRAARAAVHALGAHASMDEIASHAGTSKTVFYRYFGDREGLRLAVAERVTAHMERRLLEAVDGPSSGADALHRMVEVYLTVAATSPQVYAFAVAPAPAAPDAPAPAPVLGPFLERVYGVLESGLVRDLAARGRTPDPGDPLALWPRAAVGLVRAAAETWLRTEPPERIEAATMARAIAGWLLTGVASSVPDSPDPARSHPKTGASS
ncbi:TetR/AcrR family transcriptional regulator [Micrococcus endophyticus]|uniref:TetR/AcrR family transcriptional regulator n=1 Tax=Micrococcus endophyticus TaxID=455343 RepID=UPI0020031488|nr:TetR/AcrR family transcriptional regulator [Micrococcus endophyticus]